jgi:hypothetical protein
VEEATDFVRVEGFVMKPEFAKRSRGEQYFFVNERFIRSNYLEHAVRSAYDELVARDNYPGWFLHMEHRPGVDRHQHPPHQDGDQVPRRPHGVRHRARGGAARAGAAQHHPEPRLRA